jgi:phosphoglycolate phosphatase
LNFNYKHIIWDWNGTLFNDVELCVDIINGILTRRYIDKLSLDKYRDIFTFPVQDYYLKAGLDFSVYSFEELGKEWIDAYQQRRLEANLHNGVEDLLNLIKLKRIEQSVLSAYMQNTLTEIVEHFGLNKFFTHLAGLDHIYATSKVEPGKDLMSRLGNGRHEVVLIGDTVHDFEVAQEIGADCILIANGHQSKEKLSECGVLVLNSLEELKASIKSV